VRVRWVWARPFLWSHSPPTRIGTAVTVGILVRPTTGHTSVGIWATAIAAQTCKDGRPRTKKDNG